MWRAAAAACCGIAIAALAMAQGRDGPPALNLPAVPLVKAEPGPAKIRPTDPGGFKVPHRDKTIYNRIESDRSKSRPGQSAELLKKTGKNPSESIARYKIQLGIFHDAQAADRHWAKLRDAHIPLLGNSSKIIERATINNGKIEIYRLQAGPVSSLSEGQKLCEALMVRKVGCFVVKVT